MKYDKKRIVLQWNQQKYKAKTQSIIHQNAQV